MLVHLKMLHMTILQCTLSCCNLHCFDATSILSHFIHVCVEQKFTQKSCLWSKNYKYHVWHTSRLRLGVSAKALAKFWRLIGFRKYFFLFTIRKRRSIAFQPCITLGGVHWVEMGQNNDFLQKSGQKTAFLSITILDHPTLDWAGTQNVKGITNFNICFEK